jgi:di/tricarboxylate transporter
MIVTLTVLFVAMVLFIQGKIRSDIIALLALVILLVFGVLTTQEALSGFANPIILMMIGLFVVGGAIFRTGLAKIVGSQILRIAGDSEEILFIVVMGTTVCIGAFVSNTGTAALMLPIVMSVAAGTKSGPERFLMPMAFACSMGGLFTLIGTPPNMVISDTLVKNGYPALHFFSFSCAGLVAFAVGLLVLLPLTKIFLSRKKKDDNRCADKGKTLKELACEYQLTRNISRVRLQRQSLLAGKKLADLEIPRRYNLSVIEIRRQEKRGSLFLKSDRQEMAGPQTQAFEGDVLHVLGDIDNVKKFALENNLTLLEGVEDRRDTFHFRQIGIAELLLMPDASLINKSVLDTKFRTQYGVNLLGIQRKGEYILHELKDATLLSRDILLVQGTWDNIRKLSEANTEWIVLGQPLEEAAKVTLDHKMPAAAGIMLLMVGLMVSNLVPPVAAVLIAAILMVLVGCFRTVEDAYKTINWESVVLIAAMLPMSVALEKTGASGIVAQNLVSKLGQFGPYALLGGLYLTTSVTTMFISNTATAVLLSPIGMSAAIRLGVSPYPFLFAVTVAASMCFASPFSTPPNALVLNAGRYMFLDYIKVGLPLQIIIGIVMVFVLPLIFPFYP